MEVSQTITSTQVNNNYNDNNNNNNTPATTMTMTSTQQLVILNDKLCEIEAAILRSNEIIDCKQKPMFAQHEEPLMQNKFRLNFALCL